MCAHVDLSQCSFSHVNDELQRSGWIFGDMNLNNKFFCYELRIGHWVCSTERCSFSFFREESFTMKVSIKTLFRIACQVMRESCFGCGPTNFG